MAFGLAAIHHSFVRFDSAFTSSGPHGNGIPPLSPWRDMLDSRWQQLFLHPSCIRWSCRSLDRQFNITGTITCDSLAWVRPLVAPRVPIWKSSWILSMPDTCFIIAMIRLVTRMNVVVWSLCGYNHYNMVIIACSIRNSHSQ